jgi:hypothetical protein
MPTPPGVIPDTPDTPLALDLDGDGHLRSAPVLVPFDFDADGRAEQRGWIAGDGWLVRDLDGDGRITSGRELFGSRTLIGARMALDGFEALAALDANHDGVVDARDPLFSEVRIWRDANADGRSANELTTLQAEGIAALHVKSNAARGRKSLDSRGRVRLFLESTYVRTDGSEHPMFDVLLKRGH